MEKRDIVFRLTPEEAEAAEDALFLRSQALKDPEDSLGQAWVSFSRTMRFMRTKYGDYHVDKPWRVISEEQNSERKVASPLKRVCPGPQSKRKGHLVLTVAGAVAVGIAVAIAFLVIGEALAIVLATAIFFSLGTSGILSTVREIIHDPPTTLKDSSYSYLMIATCGTLLTLGGLCSLAVFVGIQEGWWVT